LVVAKARAASDIRASQVRREIVFRFQEHWWLFGGVTPQSRGGVDAMVQVDPTHLIIGSDG